MSKCKEMLTGQRATEHASRADRLTRLFCNVIDRVITTRALTSTVGNALSRAQFAGLQYVYLHPNGCIKDLAEGLAVSHPAAVKLVERLEHKGLVARRPCQRDHRVVELVTTPKGTRWARAVIAARSQSVARLVEEANEAGNCNLLRCLEVFIEAALKHERSPDGVCLHCGEAHADECPVGQAEMQQADGPAPTSSPGGDVSRAPRTRPPAGSEAEKAGPAPPSR